MVGSRSSLLVASSAVLLFASLASTVQAQGGQSCGIGLAPCSAAAPCCSEFGFCGTGTFCLGGCNPLHSATYQSCAPQPLCLPNTYTFENLDRVQVNASKYDGNATAHDWVIDKGEAVSTGSELVLTLTEQNGGTRMSSTRYVHYGTINFRLKTSSAAGVVTAAITMSDVKDEIDVEMPGPLTSEFQTNYFWLGKANYTAGVSDTIRDLSNTKEIYHDYQVDWQPDQIQWSVDGNITTTITKESTLSADGQRYEYPSTPSRVQISIWPAGISSSAQGTIDWAGGMIDWQSDEIKQNGYYSVQVQSVAVTCSPSQASVVNASSQSYVYSLTNDTHGNPYVTVSTLSTLLGGASRTSSTIGTAALVAAVMGTVALLI